MEKKKSISSVLMPLLLIALLVSPTIALVLSPTRAMVFRAMHGQSASILMDFGFMFFQCCLFLSPAFLFYRKIKVYVYLFFPFFFLAPAEVFYTFSYGIGITTAIIGVVKESNYREINEFFGGFIVIVILAILVYLLILVLIVKKIPKVYPQKALFSVSAVSILVVYITFTFDMFQGRGMPYPFNLINAARQAVNETNKINRHQELTRNFSFNAYKKDQLNQREVYVLILGETARYDNWAINGYGRNTSPRLSLRSNLISYSNVSTSSTLTRYSVPLILTRATASDFNRNYSEKSFISAFGDAGFKTYWISNQLTGGFSETNIISHAKDADHLIFINKTGSLFTTGYDEKIVTIFESIMAETHANIFVVLHTIGNHYQYSMRYPDEFDIFKPSSVWLNLKEYKDLIINSYDNSILYADFIIDEVIEVLNKNNLISSVMYISDHGENLFDDARYLSRRQTSKYVLHIPLFVWTSDSYNDVYPEKKENIFANKNKAVSTENIFYSILDMSNIGFDGEDFSRSIANGAFQPTQRSFIGPSGRVMNSETVLERLDK